MKNYILVFLISVLIISTVGTLSLIGTLPQNDVDTNVKVEEYENVNKEDFKFENTKNITNEKIERKYEVTEDSLMSFKKKYMYKPGNVNPFSSEIDIYNETVNNNNNNTNDQTNNSNGGNENSSNTGK